MSKTKGLPFEMRQHIKGHYKNRATRKAYKKHARYYWTFVKARGYTANQVRENPRLFLQAYADQLVADKKSANTIHTYLSFCMTTMAVNTGLMFGSSRPRR